MDTANLPRDEQLDDLALDYADFRVLELERANAELRAKLESVTFMLSRTLDNLYRVTAAQERSANWLRLVPELAKRRGRAA